MARYKKTSKKNKSAPKSDPEAKAKRGPTAIELTEQQRRQIKHLAGMGLTWNNISLTMEIPVRTLQRHAGKDYRDGIEAANGIVCASLFKMATDLKMPAPAIFWMKTRAGWRETSRIEHAVAPEALQEAIGLIVAEIRANLPRRCPGCKTHLKLGQHIGAKLMELSRKIEAGGLKTESESTNSPT